MYKSWWSLHLDFFLLAADCSANNPFVYYCQTKIFNLPAWILLKVEQHFVSEVLERKTAMLLAVIGLKLTYNHYFPLEITLAFISHYQVTLVPGWFCSVLWNGMAVRSPCVSLCKVKMTKKLQPIIFIIWSKYQYHFPLFYSDVTLWQGSIIIHNE